MTSSSSQKCKSGRKARTVVGGMGGGRAAVVTAAQQSAKRPGRRRVAGASKKGEIGKADVAKPDPSPPNPNADRHMFGNNIAIYGGQFTQAENILPVVDSSQVKPSQLLHMRVAPSAFHNSAQRVDPPRCHPDTRVAILRSIYDWIAKSEDREQWLFWLNGAAGAGKSAIMQSSVEFCVQAAIAIASFFFFRTDPARNTMAPLIATLAYQLILAIPETKDDIYSTIEQNPLIFDQSLESQLQQLVVQPLLRLPRHLQRLFVVFIDGLDECNNRNLQSNLIKLLGNISRSETIPIKFVLASRREPQIEAAFRQKPTFDRLLTLPLDNSDIQQTSDDIRRFIIDRFNEIKETHLRKDFLPIDWPTSADIEQIVVKSSGQFIYASVVMNYISSPYTHPALQLEIINGIRLRSSSSQNPFDHLDALYEYIFSQVKEPDIVRNILAFILATGGAGTMGQEITSLRPTFQLASGELEVYFADLISVIQIESRQYHTSTQLPSLKFLHASLPDFLTDKSRSEGYHIDLDDYRTKLLCMFLERLPPTINPSRFSTFNDLGTASNQEIYRLIAIRNLLKGAKASDKLHSAFMNFKFILHKTDIYEARCLVYVSHCTEILAQLQQLHLNDQGKAYNHFMNAFAVEYARYWSLLNDDVKSKIRAAEALYETQDFSIRISQIVEDHRYDIS